MLLWIVAVEFMRLKFNSSGSIRLVSVHLFRICGYRLYMPRVDEFKVYDSLALFKFYVFILHGFKVL